MSDAGCDGEDNREASETTQGSTALVSVPSQCTVPPDNENETSLHSTSVDDDGESCVKLDALGPIVLNTDGTMGRIANWANFTDIEKSQAIRLISARNKKRKEVLKNAAATNE